MDISGNKSKHIPILAIISSINIIVTQHFRVVYHGISRQSALHNYFIPCQRRYSVEKAMPCSRLTPIAAGVYPGFSSMKQLGVFLLPLERMLVHHRSLPRSLLGFPNNFPVLIYTPGWREAL